MDHSGLYTDLDNFTTNCGTSSNSNFSDSCPTLLPSLNNFKYQQTTLTSNIYQPNIAVDHHQQHQSQSAKNTTSLPSTGLPQTQININNCNNNIFFPLDDVLFSEVTSIGTDRSGTVVTQQCPSTSANASSGNGQKNNFINYLRKESNTNGSGGGGGDNITYNINNINTNIVNNVVNNSDIFTGNQYHQISKPALGETIINFTNNNLNSSGNSSMPVDTASVTSQQNYYNFQANTNVQGQQQQQTSQIFETSGQTHQQTTSAQHQSSSTFGDTSYNNMGLFHGNHLYQGQSSASQKNGNGYIPGNTQQDFPSVPPLALDSFYKNDHQDSLSPAAKIINSFESKNPLKYPTGRVSGSYYGKSSADFPQQFSHHASHPPQPMPHLSHGYSNVYQNSKIPPSQIYPENYQNIPLQTPPRSAYPPQHFTNERSPPAMNRHPSYPSMPPHHPTNAGYGSYYSNGFNPHYPSPYTSQLPPPSSYCSKPSPASFGKSSSLGVPPVDPHNNFPLPHARSFTGSKKEFFQEGGHFFSPHHQMPHSNFYEDSKKTSNHRAKVIPPEMYNNPAYNEHHLMSAPHPSTSMRYQQMPKPPSFNGAASYPTMQPPQNSLDYGYQNFHHFPPYKNSTEHHKMPKINHSMTSQQYHYDLMSSPHHMQPYRYHTMQVKPSEKMKTSIDLEEQINSSKIAKMHHNQSTYGYDPSHHPHAHFYHHHQQLHPHHLHSNSHPSHMMASRNHLMSDDPKSAAGQNINLSLRDFLQTWNEIDDEDDGTRLVEDVERKIRREFNPLFMQKSTENFSHAIMEKPPTNVVNEANDRNEKLYVLESRDVPLSELNKYKHLSVINKLPENVVIDKELYGDVDGSMKFIDEIDLTREKLYKSEFELEFEACQEGKVMKPPTIEETIPIKVQEKVTVQENKKIEVVSSEIIESSLKVFEDDVHEVTIEAFQKKKALKVKVPKEKSPKIKQQILKLKKEKIMKDPKKFRITKRMKKYSLTTRTSAVRSLKSICIDFVNTSQYRNFARHQLSVINKHSKMRVLKDFKKKFNFNGIKKQLNPSINQKLNHSVRINSLTEICGINKQDEDIEYEDDDYDDDEDIFKSINGNSNIHEVSSLKNICKQFLIDMNFDVVENVEPPTLREICENFIYNNRQYFHIEEVNNVPKLQELCKEVLGNENIFVNFTEGASVVVDEGEVDNVVENRSTVNDHDNDSNEPIYIVEENSGNVGELFESENLNSYEKTEILRRIQRVANIEDDDEIMRAIGALHVDPIIDNNNECDVSNKNIQGSVECFPEANEFSLLNGDDMKFDSEMTFVSYLNDDLLHSVQYEEILNDNGQSTSNTNAMEILRYKNLSRACKQQQRKTVGKVLKRCKKSTRKSLAKRCDNSTETPQVLNESPKCDVDAKDSMKIEQQKSKSSIVVDRNVSSRVESNLPKLPSVLPSMNEYRIERNSNHHRNNIKDKQVVKPRKISFEESLLSIEKKELKRIVDDEDEKRERRRSSTSSTSSHHSKRHHRHHTSSRSNRSHEKQNSNHRSHRRSSSRSKSRRREHQQHHHKSSRENCYKKDQIKHSEAKRLVIPSYKIYDKDLDIKLKTPPYVKMEREEKVEEIMRNSIKGEKKIYQ